jgi:2-(1,2-epoxy-1,2-dihydrophenyl)acetyl-CoA isomerase
MMKDTMQTHEGVAWGVDGGIGRIVLQNPKKANALGPGSAAGLARAIDAVLAAMPRVVLLTAEGPIFCAGGDLDALKGALPNLDALIDRLVHTLHPAIQRLVESPVPVVCAVNGAVGGAGVGVALCADFVLASTSMKLRTGYAGIGLSPDVGTSWFLARRIGSQKAKQWLMLSDAIDAQHCLEAGVVDSLHAEDELLPAAEALAHRLAAGARGSLGAIKQLCDGMPQRTLGQHLALEHELLAARSRSADAAEGIASFIGRRKPRFTD